MTTPSETVQAAQRLLAERERVGLAKYGTTVDRKDLRPGDWLRHAIEEASDLLLYLISLERELGGRTPDSELPTLSEFAGVLCQCGERPKSRCPGTWEPGCDMGANEAHAVAAGEDVEALRQALDDMGAPDYDEQSPPIAVPGNPGRAAPKGFVSIAEAAASMAKFGDALRNYENRAAYIARWSNSPAEATHVVQDPNYGCWWVDRLPYQKPSGYWDGGTFIRAGENLLGRVACEPRPQPAADPEREAYLKRWEGAPEWAVSLEQMKDRRCFWVGPFGPVSFGRRMYAGSDLLGSVRCEPRPEVKP